MSRIVFFLLVILLSTSCEPDSKTDISAPNPIAYDTPKDISEVEPRFKPAAGEQQFRAACITCHSLRYIEMQPDFSRKTWTKIVDKMVHSFGAPLDSVSAKAVVDYLVAAKGK